MEVAEGNVKMLDDDAGAPVRGALFVVGLLGAASVDLSAGLPIFSNILVVDVEAEAGVGAGAELDELVFWAPPRLKRLEAVVVGVVDSVGLDDKEGKLNDGLDAFDPALENAVGNRGGALGWANGLEAADCSPMFWKSDFGASA